MPRVRIGELELFHTADGAGEPVLLVMGLGGEHHAWDLVRRELARRYRLVLLDNRDAGASDEARGPYGTGDMAADALGGIDHLVSERVHVVGAASRCAMARPRAVLVPAHDATLPRVGVVRVPASRHACCLETPKPLAGRVLRFLARHPLAA